MTTGNYFVVCTLVGKPCGSNNQADKTAKAETINHQVTGRSESYQTEHDAMVTAISTTDVTMTTLHTQSVNTVATSCITNNTTTNTVRVNNTITSNGSSLLITVQFQSLLLQHLLLTQAHLLMAWLVALLFLIKVLQLIQRPLVRDKHLMFALLVVLLHNHHVCLLVYLCVCGILMLPLDVQSNAEVNGFRSSVVLDSKVSSHITGNVTMAGKIVI